MSNFFDGVPEGTTHRYGRVLYKFTDDAVFIWSGDRWTYSAPPSAYEDGSMDEIVARPKQWSGPQDGLPPVGERVDYMGYHCTVVVHVNERGQKGSILQGDDDWFYGTEITIDKIRTAADIAAEQRETAIREMAKVLPSAKHECYTFNADGSVKPYATTHEILGLLVDAGFKREVV